MKISGITYASRRKSNKARNTVLLLILLLILIIGVPMLLTILTDWNMPFAEKIGFLNNYINK